MLLTLMRHGEVEGPANVLRGWSDPPVTAHGRQQMELAASAFLEPAIGTLYSSPSRRCREFALEWSQRVGIQALQVPALREIHFGVWEELTLDAASTLDPASFERFKRDPETWTSPGGESFAMFRGRVLECVRQLCNVDAACGMVTHAGVMRVIIADALQIPFHTAQRIALMPGAVCQLWYAPDGNHALLSLRAGLER